jgi:hypothetical protein
VIEGPGHEDRIKTLQLRFKRASPKAPASAKLSKIIRSNIGLIAIAGAALLAILLVFETQNGSSFASATAAADETRLQEPYYHRCADARAAGVAPILRGEPGYRAPLDADNDGIACEPYWR